MVAVGIALLPQERWVSARRKWEQVEEWGFDHAWTYDHLAWRTLVDQPWFATVPLLAAAAAVTERIGLGHVGGVAELPAPGPVREGRAGARRRQQRPVPARGGRRR